MTVKRKVYSDSLICSKRSKNIEDDGTWAYLPDDILIDIFLRLPIGSILSCRCVSNRWRSIILDPYFAKMHSQCAPINILLRPNNLSTRVSTTLHLLDFDVLKRLPCRYFCCHHGSCKDFPTSTCACHVKLGIKLKLPLRRVLHTMLEARRRGKKRTIVGCKPKDDKFNIVASYNGLLYLCEPLTHNGFHLYVRNPDPLTLVCNPLTGEFIRLPKSNNNRVFGCYGIYFGFGYVKKTDEYKMVRISQWSNPYDHLTFEVHTLGTESWRNIEYHGQFWKNIMFPTCLNGSLYWFVDRSNVASILCIDLESETQNLLPCPTIDRFVSYHIVFGVLKGSLCICHQSTNANDYKFWMMKRHGDGHSWTEDLNFNVMGLNFQGLGKLHFIGHEKMVYHINGGFIYYDLEKHLFNWFECRGTPFRLESIAYTPSLIRLKDIVKGDNVEVFNVHSRHVTSKMREDEEILYLCNSLIFNNAGG